MYSPGASFLHELRNLDKRLGCYYNQDHEHFVITWQRATGQPIPVLLIEDEAGGFRRPNMSDIMTLQQSDCGKTRLYDRMERSAKYFEETRQKTRAKSRDFVHHQTQENRRQLLPRFARLANEGGKNNSTFRRINPLQKGLNINQIMGQ